MASIGIEKKSPIQFGLFNSGSVFFLRENQKIDSDLSDISIQFSILNSKTEPKILIKYLYIYSCTYVSLTQIVAPNQSPHTRTNEITNRSHQIQSPQKSPSPGKRSIHKPNYSFVPFLHTSYIANNASKSSSKQIYFKFHHQQPRQQKRRKTKFSQNIEKTIEPTTGARLRSRVYHCALRSLAAS